MAEAIAVDVGKDLAVEASKSVYSIIAKHVKYLLCYGRTAKELDSQVKALVPTRDSIQQRVAAAERAGDLPLPVVEQWLKDFHTIESEAKNITEEVQHVCCYMGSCWNLRLGYSLSKKAVEKMEMVERLRTDGTFPVVACGRPAPDVAERFKSEGFQMFEPTKRTMEEVMEALKKEETYIVGVYGMGGVGKTTLVKEVAKRAKNEGLFVNAVMATASQNPNVINMQAEIAEGLGLKLEVTTEGERAVRILERLKELKKVLIILDDLWGRLELFKLGIPNKAECEGCKIVITTRKLVVCTTMDSSCNIKVNILSEQESWDLFKSKAGLVVESGDVEKLARAVAAECQGLPLALITLGSSMRNKKQLYQWKTTLKDLQSAAPELIGDMEKEVFVPVQLSIKNLEPEIRLCFLFCCLFPEDYEINLQTIMYYVVGEGVVKNWDTLMEAESRVHTMFDQLQDASLLLECDRAEHVKMHDVVRDVARWTAETSEDYGFLVQAGTGLRSWDEEMDVKERKRISLMGNEIVVVPEQPMCPKLRTLLMGGNDELKKELPERFFEGMTSLLVLDLNKVHLISLPASLSSLTHLKTLILDRYGGSDISPIGELKQLEVLSLIDCDGISEFPEGMGNLIKLRVLDLSDCSGLELRSNILSRLTRLERLYMIRGFTKWQVGSGGDDTSSLAAFSELACLRRLTHLYVTVDNEECLWEELNPTHPWPMLQKFYIDLEGFQRSILIDDENDESNNSLMITKRISNWVKGLLRREINYLGLHELEDTEYLFSADADTIPQSVLSNLRGLEIEYMPRLKSIFKGPLPLLDGSLEKLRRLTINECGALTDVFSTADILSRMHNLEGLEVASCSDIRVVFNYDDELIMREEGDDGSSGASSSTSAAAAASRPPGVVLLPNLWEMRLSRLPRLTSLWDGMVPQGTLIIHPKLQRLYVIGCRSIKYIVSPALVAAHAFEQLEEIRIWWCDELERLMMPSCWGTDCHAAAATAFAHLRILHIVECHSLTSLFSWRQAVQGLPQLEKLSINDCSGMREIIGVWEEDDEEEQQPTVPIMLPKLQVLSLLNLPALSRFHGGRSAMPNSSTSTIALPSLTTLDVEKCPELKELPFGLDSLPNLLEIRAEEKWLGALKLEDDSVKPRLRALFKPWGE